MYIGNYTQLEQSKTSTTTLISPPHLPSLSPSLSFQVWYPYTCISSAGSAVVVLMFKYIHKHILVQLQICVYNTQVYVYIGAAPAMSFCTLYVVQFCLRNFLHTVP